MEDVAGRTSPASSWRTSPADRRHQLFDRAPLARNSKITSSQISLCPTILTFFCRMFFIFLLKCATVKIMTHVRLIRPRMAAERLGVSRSTIYRWFWEGTLQGVKIAGGTVRILESSIDDKLAGIY